ncbi:MAG: putative aminoacrylate peracid reductase RutC [bacterium ADurb.Bin429]|nr:MAG: putative aminoacrylate peracid reductase RutC [bacterium ADurb.Bin429]
MMMPWVGTGIRTIVDDALPVTVSASRFAGRDGVEEYHLMLTPTAGADVATQLRWLEQAHDHACAALGLDTGTAIFRRLFCSDLSNQTEALAASPLANPREPGDCCVVSLVCQPPVPPARVALWAYHVHEPGVVLDTYHEGSTLALRRGELTHRWTAGLTCPDGGGPAAQTTAILEAYEAELDAQTLTLADHVVRTWFFVRDVDANYGGLVAARKARFAERGLTPETHYIASTGIEGAAADPRATVMMDAYAIGGVRPEQIRFLSAPDHLCPTHRYGVTFERGVAIAFRDRTHVLISGTASIDHAGAIVYPGDVRRQCDRTFENIGALLADASATFDDVGMYLVYVRDPADLDLARRLMTEHVGAVPTQILLAPVCRPGWLIEVECQAVIPTARPELPEF